MYGLGLVGLSRCSGFTRAWLCETELASGVRLRRAALGGLGSLGRVCASRPRNETCKVALSALLITAFGASALADDHDAGDDHVRYAHHQGRTVVPTRPSEPPQGLSSEFECRRSEAELNPM